MKSRDLHQWGRTQALWYWFEQVNDGTYPDVSFEDWLAGFIDADDLNAEVGDYCPELWGDRAEWRQAGRQLSGSRQAPVKTRGLGCAIIEVGQMVRPDAPKRRETMKKTRTMTDEEREDRVHRAIAVVTVAEWQGLWSTDLILSFLEDVKNGTDDLGLEYWEAELIDNQEEAS